MAAVRHWFQAPSCRACVRSNPFTGWESKNTKLRLSRCPSSEYNRTGMARKCKKKKKKKEKEVTIIQVNYKID